MGDSKTHKNSFPPTKVVKERDSWMDFGLMAEASSNSRNDLPERKSQKTIERERKEETQKQEWLKRELNPNILKEHGTSIAVKKKSSEEDRSKNNAWIERAFQRAKEQAKREGRTIEE